jgi:2-polyprenyl-3-methyl-5-hydroxy-6-metoxy-1,4-benzoquinol methylase
MVDTHAAAAEPAISATDRIIIEELYTLEASANRTYEWLYDIIAPSLGRSLLEVGSGVGVISKFLVARGDPLVLTDYQAPYLGYLRERFGDAPHLDYRLLDLSAPPYDIGGRRVDTIVCVNVLEHLADDHSVLRNLRDLLAPGGRLILQVPNYPALYGSLDEAYGHYRRYTQRTLTECILAAGFELSWIRNFNPLSIPGWIVSAKILRLRTLNVTTLRLYNALVPLARRLDGLSRLGGLALIACAQKPD